MSDIEYHNVCRKLDVVVLNVLDLLQKILQERQFLDESLKNGFVNLAKSRYLMGSKNVSTLQIRESDLLPMKKVVSDKEMTGDLEFKNFKIIDTSEMSSSKITSSVRHRGLESASDDLAERVSEIGLSKSEEKVVDKKQKDPLKWFGVLVPQSLRSAQSSFQNTLSTIAHIASLQNELTASMQEYKKLIIKKCELTKER